MLKKPRSQPALHRLDDDDVFALDLIDEIDHCTLLLLGHTLGEEELIDRQATMLVDWQDDIRRCIAGAGVDVKHEVRPEISIDSFRAFVGPERLLALRSGARLARTPLYGASLVGNDLVLIEINQFGESRMGDGAMVALKEILDHDLPIRLDRIFPALAKLKCVNVGPA